MPRDAARQQHPLEAGIIFCSSKKAVDQLYDKLRQNSWRCQGSNKYWVCMILYSYNINRIKLLCIYIYMYVSYDIIGLKGQVAVCLAG